MQQINKNQGCCSKIPAKNFEIILIIGFLLSTILLIVNLIISLWCFKHSYPLFIIEIGLLSLNVISFILSIILRVWRSNFSVFNTNFSSSNGVAVFNLILIIINLLSSIAEEVLFSFVISYLSEYADEESREIIFIYQWIEDIPEELRMPLDVFLSYFFDIEDFPKKLEKLKKRKKYSTK